MSYKTLAVFQQQHPLRSKIDEHTSASRFTRNMPRVRSKYLPDVDMDNGSAFTCPKCQDDQPDIQHGELRQCDCGMLYERFGNSLGIGRAK